MDGYGHRIILYSSCPVSLLSLTVMMNEGFPGRLTGKTASLEVFEQMVKVGGADSVFLDVDVTVLADALFLLEEIRMQQPRLLIVVMVPTSFDHITLHVKGRVVNVLLRRMYEGDAFIWMIQDIFRVANAHSSVDPLDIPFAAYWKEYSTHDTGPELSPFELLVLTKYCEHKNSEQIAEEMHVEIQTVEVHRLSLQKKLGVSNTAGMIFFAVQKGVFIG